MRSRNISDDEFIQVTRGLVRYQTPYHGELTKYNQTINDLEVHYATEFKNNMVRISHLRIVTKWDKATLFKPVNLILTNEHKKDLYKILKSLSSW